MNTTAVFAEILIVGLEACVWLLFLLGCRFDLSRIHLEAWKGWEALATVLVLGLAYTLGILVDRVSDSLGDAFRKITAPPAPADTPASGPKRKVSVGAMRVAVLMDQGALVPFLEYQRSRSRIARGTVFNLPLILLFGHLFLRFRTKVGGDVLAFFDWTLLALFLLSYFAEWRILKAYEDRLRDAYHIVCDKARREPKPGETIGRVPTPTDREGPP